MNQRSARGLRAMLTIGLAALACNLSTAAPQAPNAPITSQEDLAKTAAAIVLTAQLPGSPAPESQAPQGVTGTATACAPIVTASTNANLRDGPGTAYEAVGSLMQGDTAPLVGKNDDATWWYVEFDGSHAWISAGVTTAACTPEALPVIAAAPPPEEAAAAAPEAAKPDLVITEFTITPSTPTMGTPAHVRISAYNQGNAPSAECTVVWYGYHSDALPGCAWTLQPLPAHGGKVLECDHTFTYAAPSGEYSEAMVDVNHQVDESNEDNNEATISPFGAVAP